MAKFRGAALADMAVYPLVICGLAAAIAAPLVLFIEVFEWATSSEWPGLTLSDGLRLFGIQHIVPETESQRLLDVAMAIPLTFILFLAGIFMFLTGLNLGSWDDERRIFSQMPEEPAGALLFLAFGAEVGMLQFVRLVLVEWILRLLFWGGLVLIALELVALAFGLSAGWLAVTGAASLLAAVLSRRAMGRKLDRLSARAGTC